MYGTARRREWKRIRNEIRLCEWFNLATHNAHKALVWWNNRKSTYGCCAGACQRSVLCAGFKCVPICLEPFAYDLGEFIIICCICIELYLNWMSGMARANSVCIVRAVYRMTLERWANYRATMGTISTCVSGSDWKKRTFRLSAFALVRGKSVLCGQDVILLADIPVFEYVFFPS